MESFKVKQNQRIDALNNNEDEIGNNKKAKGGHAINNHLYEDNKENIGNGMSSSKIKKDAPKKQSNFRRVVGLNRPEFALLAVGSLLAAAKAGDDVA